MPQIKVEWEDEKDKANAKTHGISFAEAATVFYDPLEMTVPDPDHSHSEQRFLIFGESSSGRLMVVSYTTRGEVYRLISARKLTASERKLYEQGQDE